MAIACPLCSSEKTSLITNKVRFGKEADVYICSDCSLIFLDQSSFDLPPDFYEGEYHQTYLAHIEPALLDPGEYYHKMLKVTKPWSDKINELLIGNEIVLDFGCSTGHVISNIQEKAGKVYGHELNAKEVEFCRSIGLDVASEPLDERFSMGYFDYIVMVFVLEHISEPVALLKYLKGFLKSGGKFLILVPNAQDPLLKLFDIPEFLSFYYCVEHLFYYTPDSIQLLFDQAGLVGNIVPIQEYPLTNHLNWGYRRRPSDTIASRKNIPDIPIRSNPGWEDLWKRIDLLYKEYALTNGYADRLWCEVSIK